MPTHHSSAPSPAFLVSLSTLTSLPPSRRAPSTCGTCFIPSAPCRLSAHRRHSVHLLNRNRPRIFYIRLSLDDGSCDDGSSSSSSASDGHSSSSSDSQQWTSSAQSESGFEPIYELSQLASAASNKSDAAQPSTIAFVDSEIDDSGKVKDGTGSKTDPVGSSTPITPTTDQQTEKLAKPTDDKKETDEATTVEKRQLLQTVLSFFKRCFEPPAYIVGIFTGMTVAILLIFIPIPGSRDALLRQKVTLFDVILHDIEDSYVDKVDINRLFETGVNSMLGTLDPYTQFENNAQAVEMSVKTNGRYAGVGLGLILGEPSSVSSNQQPTNNDTTTTTTNTQSSSIQSTNHNANAKESDEKDKKVRPIIVMSAFEGYAFDAGVRPGDIIQSVEGTSVTGVSLEKVTDMLRGEPGTTVGVAVRREGFKQPLSFTLSRKDVQIRDVPASAFVGNPVDGIAYIRLQSFAKDAAAEVSGAIDGLEATGNPIRSVILDLRGNPGGLLNAAIEVSELFVPKDSTIVSTKGRGLGNAPTYVSSREPRVNPKTTRLAVLVNGQTASASEIVAGAVQDLDLGVVVGSRTFGKGLVQNVQELPYNTALKFTVGKYYTPSGRCIQSLNYAQAEGESNQFEMKEVEESQRKFFHTKKGRMVRDGCGIEPDFDVSKQPSSLEIALHKQNMYFQFATRFGATTKLETLPDNFEVNETIYKDFVRYVSEAGFKYESRFDEAFDELDEMLKDFGYDAARTRLGELKQTTNSEMRSDFLRHERDIRSQLESAIRFRFQPDSKRIVADLKNDEQLTWTIDILKNSETYNRLLGNASDEGLSNQTAQSASKTVQKQDEQNSDSTTTTSTTSSQTSRKTIARKIGNIKIS